MTQRTPRRARSAVTALAGALALTAISFVSPTSAQAATKFIVVQHNVEKNGAAITHALAKAHSLGAQAVTLQEVCASDVPLIQNYAASVGQTWSVHAQQSRTAGCGTRGDVMTVAVRTAAGADNVVRSLSQDESVNDDGSLHTRQQELVCVRWTDTSVRTVCSVHVALGKAYVVGNPTLNARKTQIKEIKDITATFIGNGQLVVVGGDFNAVPKDPVLNRMYARGVDEDGNSPNGNFFEAAQLEGQTSNRGGNATDQSGKRKIDHVFFSNNKTPWTQTGAAFNALDSPSDHQLVVAKATVQG